MSLHLCHRHNGLGKFDDVRFGSLADIGVPQIDVRLATESGHATGIAPCPLSANSRRPARFPIAQKRGHMGSGNYER
jgi:hypothetical protein